MFERSIETNRDIRKKIEKMLVNSKTSRSRRVCVPIDTIYKAVYLDKWERLTATAEKCPHGLLRPSFWDVFWRGAGGERAEEGGPRREDHWVSVRKSFSRDFEFELVNSCLLDLNKKSGSH